VLGDTVIDLNIFDESTGDQIVDAVGYGGNIGLGPSHGTLNVQDSTMLFAGVPYFVYYSMSIYFPYLPPPDAYGEGFGEAHFAITPVPEPTSLAMLAASFFISFGRKRHGRR
jgi:hypothetical protein